MQQLKWIILLVVVCISLTAGTVGIITPGLISTVYENIAAFSFGI